MYRDLFQQLGLSKNEAEIYEMLLKLGESSISQIAVKTGINRRNVYDVINRMMDKGLAYVILQKRENLYRPSDPSRLSEMIEEKKAMLDAQLPELNNLFHATPKEHEVYIYRGPEGWKNYMRDMIRIGETAYFISAKGGWLDERVKNFFPYFYKETQEKKMTFYHLFDHEVKEGCPQILDYVTENYKFLPKEYAAPGAIDIFGDHVNIFPKIQLGGFEEEFSFTVIVNAQVAESFRTWFRFMWDHCP